MPMNIPHLLGSLLAASILTGCATAQLDDLKEVKSAQGMLVAEPISFTFGSSAIMMSGVQAGLLPGYYSATKENANGTFYLGVGQCVWYKGKEAYSLVTGGIWLPKNAENPARLFSVVGSTATSVKTLDEATASCKQPKASNGVEVTALDLQTVLAMPQAFGISPAGRNGTLSGTQAVGAAIGFSIAQSIADSAKGEYQVLQKVEDPTALNKFSAAVQLGNKIHSTKP